MRVALDADRRRRRIGSVGRARLLFRILSSAVAATVLLAAAGIASAAGLPTIILDPPSGASGSTITVSGTGWSGAPESSPIEIHWESADGQLMGTTAAHPDGTFDAVAVQIPNVPNGYYMVVATQTDEAGQPIEGAPAKALFGVKAASTDGGSGGGSSGGGDTARTDGGNKSTGGSAETDGSTIVTSGADEDTATGSGDASSDQKAERKAGRDEPDSLIDLLRKAQQKALAGAKSSSKTSGGAVQKTFPLSAPAPSTGAIVSAVPPPVGPMPTAPALKAPSASAARVSSSDLWAGLGNSVRPALSSSALGGKRTTAIEGGSGSLRAGIVLFSIGLIALLGGFYLAETRRRSGVAVADLLN